MSKKIKDLYRKALAKGARGITVPKGDKEIHTKVFHKCVTSVAKSGGAKSPYAVCMAKLGKEKAVKKSHRRIARPGR